MELKAGMYGLRSPVFPYFYVGVSWLSHLLAGDRVLPFRLWQIAHVVISSLLPLAVYRYVARLYRSTDTGCVAAILIASSLHLTVFGTHCLLHSFLAPLTFFALSLMLDDSRHDTGASRKTDVTNGHGAANPSRMTSPDMVQHDHNEDLLNNNNIIINNNNNNINNNNNNSQKKNGHITQCQQENHSSKHKITNGLNGHHQFHDEGSHDETSMESQSYLPMISAGFIATLVCYIRPDAALVFATNILVFPKIGQKFLQMDLLHFAIGASSALLVGVASDICFYGWGVVSPVNWFKFNVINGLSTVVFGQTSGWFYLEKFVSQDISSVMLLIFSMCACGGLYFSSRVENTGDVTDNNTRDSPSSQKYEKQDSALSLTFRSVVVWAGPLFLYSLNGHKEMRFIHDVIVLVFIFISHVIVHFMRHLLRSRTVSNNVIRVVLISFIWSQWQAFPDNTNNVTWVYQKTTNVQDVNSCINFIASQNDVTGVFYDSILTMTGGMTILHHNVPIMALLDSGGFYEFGRQSRRNHTKSSHKRQFDEAEPSETVVKSINEFTSASNYIAWANAPAAARVIIKRPVYNYLVLRRDRRFIDVGFKEVFTAGNSRVLKRLLDEVSEYHLQGFLERIPIGTNTTVLLHEGDVLFHMGQFDEAAERFYQAITLNERFLDAYMPLEICYNKLGNPKAARAVMAKCQSLFDVKSCTTPRKITRV